MIMDRLPKVVILLDSSWSTGNGSNNKVTEGGNRASDPTDNHSEEYGSRENGQAITKSNNSSGYTQKIPIS